MENVAIGNPRLGTRDPGHTTSCPSPYALRSILCALGSSLDLISIDAQLTFAVMVWMYNQHSVGVLRSIMSNQ